MENCLEVGKCSWQLEHLPMLRELSIDVLKLGHVHNNILKKIRYDEFIENTFFTQKDHICGLAVTDFESYLFYIFRVKYTDTLVRYNLNILELTAKHS